MSGARYRPAAGSSPLGVIAEVEELLRRILKALATGELTGDLRAEADQLLLADGLRAGDAVQPGMGETAEWRLPDPTADDEELDLSAIDGSVGEIEVHDTREQPTTSTEEISVTRAVPPTPETPARPARIEVTDVELPEIMAAKDHPGPSRDEEPKADWFSAGEGDGEVEWPAFASPRRAKDDKRELDGEAADRVRYLFPVPDATDWDVGELRYERKRSS
jgi:hypothetical protein